MVEPAHHRLSISAQCRVLRISRSSYYYAPVPETDETLALMTVIDETFMECPWYGSRQMARHLRRAGHEVGRRRVRRLMTKMGLTPIYQRPRTSDPHPQHRVYPYLLRKLAIERPNHVWCADVTYIPMRRGFLYLVAIMDWASRKVLAWRLSNTLDAGFCAAALKEALARYGRPEIFNTDQGSGAKPSPGSGREPCPAASRSLEPRVGGSGRLSPHRGARPAAEAGKGCKPAPPDRQRGGPRLSAARPLPGRALLTMAQP